MKTPRLFREQNRPLDFRGMLLIGWFQAVNVIGRAYTELSLEIPGEVGGQAIADQIVPVGGICIFEKGKKIMIK